DQTRRGVRESTIAETSAILCFRQTVATADSSAAHVCASVDVRRGEAIRVALQPVLVTAEHGTWVVLGALRDHRRASPGRLPRPPAPVLCHTPFPHRTVDPQSRWLRCR